MKTRKLIKKTIIGSEIKKGMSVVIEGDSFFVGHVSEIHRHQQTGDWVRVTDTSGKSYRVRLTDLVEYLS